MYRLVFTYLKCRDLSSARVLPGVPTAAGARAQDSLWVSCRRHEGPSSESRHLRGGCSQGLEPSTRRPPVPGVLLRGVVA